MTNNQSNLANSANLEKILEEKAVWIEKIKNLRAYLEQEQDANKSIYENYEKAQLELANMIELGNQLCLDLKAQYMEKIHSLNQEISEFQYQLNLEMQKLRSQIG